MYKDEVRNSQFFCTDLFLSLYALDRSGQASLGKLLLFIRVCFNRLVLIFRSMPLGQVTFYS